MKRYLYSEIGNSNCGSMERRDANQPKKQSQAKIKPVLQRTIKRFGVLEEVVQWQKFDSVKHIAIAIIENFDGCIQENDIAPECLLSLLSLLTLDI